jgi:hypothetical protein
METRSEPTIAILTLTGGRSEETSTTRTDINPVPNEGDGVGRSVRGGVYVLVGVPVGDSVDAVGETVEVAVELGESVGDGVGVSESVFVTTAVGDAVTLGIEEGSIVGVILSAPPLPLPQPAAATKVSTTPTMVCTRAQLILPQPNAEAQPPRP